MFKRQRLTAVTPLLVLRSYCSRLGVTESVSISQHAQTGRKSQVAQQSQRRKSWLMKGHVSISPAGIPCLTQPLIFWAVSVHLPPGSSELTLTTPEIANEWKLQEGMLWEAEISLFQNNSSRVENRSITFVLGGWLLTHPINLHGFWNHNPTHFGFTDSCNYFPVGYKCQHVICCLFFKWKTLNLPVQLTVN